MDAADIASSFAFLLSAVATGSALAVMARMRLGKRGTLPAKGDTSTQEISPAAPASEEPVKPSDGAPVKSNKKQGGARRSRRKGARRRGRGRDVAAAVTFAAMMTSAAIGRGGRPRSASDASAASIDSGLSEVSSVSAASTASAASGASAEHSAPSASSALQVAQASAASPAPEAAPVAPARSSARSTEEKDDKARVGTDGKAVKSGARSEAAARAPPVAQLQPTDALDIGSAARAALEEMAAAAAVPPPVVDFSDLQAELAEAPAAIPADDEVLPIGGPSIEWPTFAFLEDDCNDDPQAAPECAAAPIQVKPAHTNVLDPAVAVPFNMPQLATDPVELAFASPAPLQLPTFAPAAFESGAGLLPPPGFDQGLLQAQPILYADPIGAQRAQRPQKARRSRRKTTRGRRGGRRNKPTREQAGRAVRVEGKAPFGVAPQSMAVVPPPAVMQQAEMPPASREAGLLGAAPAATPHPSQLPLHFGVPYLS